jgi:hypothetical protein
MPANLRITKDNFRINSQLGKRNLPKLSLEAISVNDRARGSSDYLKNSCVSADYNQGVGYNLANDNIVIASGLGTNGCFVSSNTRLNFRFTNQVDAIESLLINSDLYKAGFIELTRKNWIDAIDVLVLGADTSFYFGEGTCLVTDKIYIHKGLLANFGSVFTSHANVTNWVMGFAMRFNRARRAVCGLKCGEIKFVPPSDTNPTTTYTIVVKPHEWHVNGKKPETRYNKIYPVSIDDPIKLNYLTTEYQMQLTNDYLNGQSFEFSIASGEGKSFGLVANEAGFNMCGCESRQDVDNLNSRMTYSVNGSKYDSSTSTTTALSESTEKIPCINFPEIHQINIS